MAVKIIGSSGTVDYATPTTWLSYIYTLSALTAPEIGLMQNEEFNVAGVLMENASTVPTSTNYIMLAAVTGSEPTSPLRYGTGARILLDGANEYFKVAWNFTKLQNFAIKGTGSNAFIGRLWADNVSSEIRNITVEEWTMNTDTQAIFDDRAAAAVTRENLNLVLCSTSGCHALRNSNGNVTYKNCNFVALVSNSLTAHKSSYSSSPILINCLFYGWPNGEVSAYTTTGSKNCGTTNALSNSRISAVTSAVFSVSAGEFVNLTPATLDLRLVSIASQLRDKGAASGGTTTDIFGTSIYNGTRDIGAYEFTESSGTPAGGGLPYYVLRRRRGFAHTLRISG